MEASAIEVLQTELKKIVGHETDKEKQIEGFFYFCEKYVKIEDKETHRAIPFDPYPCQRELIYDVHVHGVWPHILKARRLGITWLFVLYAVWLATFFPNRDIIFVSQGKEYAKENLDRCRFVMAHMPRILRPTMTKDSAERIEFNLSNHGSNIRSLACTEKSVHSLAADVIIADEAAYHSHLGALQKGSEPALETSKGVIVVISTSNGPSGEFYEGHLIARSGKGKYKPYFYSWRERPGRTQEWYNKEKEDHEHDPLFMAQQYPETWEEAFLSGANRCIPFFKKQAPFVQEVKPEYLYKHYRAIDWGGVDPLVCLWAGEIKGEKPGLTIDPSCTNLIRELLGYSRDPKTNKPKDELNHAIDALRYLVTSCGYYEGLRGRRIHVYREIYEPDPAQRDYSIIDLATQIKAFKEPVSETVADRSRPDSIKLMNDLGIPCVGYRTITGVQSTIEEGITRLNEMFKATEKGLDIPKMANPTYQPTVRPTVMTKAQFTRGSIW